MPPTRKAPRRAYAAHPLSPVWAQRARTAHNGRGNPPAARPVLRTPDPTDRIGIALALGTAIGFGMAVALSRFAFEGGTNGLTLAAVRSCVAVLVLLVMCWIGGLRIAVTQREWLHLTGLGLLISILFYGNVGAVEYITVGLTALLVFTYPVIIAVLDAALSRRLPHPMKLLALLFAFLGLSLMLGSSFENSHPLGIALALAAGIAAAGNAVWYARTMRHVNIVVATLHMSIAAMVAIGLLALARGEFVLPRSSSGWGGFWAVVALQSLGAPVYFAAITRIGAVKAGIIANMQPLTSIVAAYLLFGERLSALQFAGGAMIVGAILVMQMQDMVGSGARSRGSGTAD